MSRDIQTTNLDDLSREELEYLRARGRLTPDQEREYLGGIERLNPQPVPIEQTPNTGDAGLAGDQSERLSADGRQVVTDEPTGEGAPADPEEDPDEEKPYEEWSKADLQAEIDARNEGVDDADKIPRTGTIAELAARLTADDEE